MPAKPPEDHKPVTRRKQLKIDGKEPEMPPCDTGYLVSHLFEVGPVLNGGMGPAPISFGELESWQRQTGICLQPWEVRLMRRLSFDYIAEMQKAEAPDCPPPWAPEDMTEQNRAAVSTKVQNAMRSFILSKAKP